MKIEAEYIKDAAKAAGFDLCGLARAEPIDRERQRFQQWLAEGRHGGMDYMARNIDIRFDPRLLMPEARTVIVCAVNYRNRFSDPLAQVSAPCRVASYAFARDYHITIKRLLRKVADRLSERYPAIKGRMLTDSAPLHEKQWAVKAGLGWIGRNSLLITPRFGSFVLLGELLINAETDNYDNPCQWDGCANCRLCEDNCPAGALGKHRGVDARRCIARLTVEAENPDEPPISKEKLHGWIFGCELCQYACPFNRFPVAAANQAVQPILDDEIMQPDYWRALTKREFERRFADTPLERPGLERLKRNAGV